MLCDCSIRVTVVLGVSQPRLLSRKFETAILNLAKFRMVHGRLLVSFPIPQNETEEILPKEGVWQMFTFIFNLG